MKNQRILALLLPLTVWPVSLPPAAADGYRDYASVVKVEPIVSGEYRTQMLRVCQPAAQSEPAVAASIGAELRQQARRWAQDPQCRMLPKRRYQQRIDGYWVTYAYGGATQVRRMPRDPGKKLPVEVLLSPRR